MLSNQHYPHRANQKLRSWANAVFQNRGVCGQAVPSFPSPSPVIHFFCSCPSFLDEPREETLATQAKVSPANCTNTLIIGKWAFFILFFLKHTHQSHNLINYFLRRHYFFTILFLKRTFTVDLKTAT